jgi:hypothetical protein
MIKKGFKLVYLSLYDLDLLDARVDGTLWVLSSRASRLIYKDSYSRVEHIAGICLVLCRSFRLRNMAQFSFFYSVINVFHKVLSLNSFRTQIDNKQEINLKLEDIFIIIEKCTPKEFTNVA